MGIGCIREELGGIGDILICILGCIGESIEGMSKC